MSAFSRGLPKRLPTGNSPSLPVWMKRPFDADAANSKPNGQPFRRTVSAKKAEDALPLKKRRDLRSRPHRDGSTAYGGRSDAGGQMAQLPSSRPASQMSLVGAFGEPAGGNPSLQ